MKKAMILCAAVILSTVSGSSTYAQATTPDQKEATGIMLRLGELYHQKAQLGDPKKELLEGAVRIMVSKNFSQMLADNARKMAALVGGDLGDKFIKDAEAIEADAAAKAKEEGKPSCLRSSAYAGRLRSSGYRFIY